MFTNFVILCNKEKNMYFQLFTTFIRTISTKTRKLQKLHIMYPPDTKTSILYIYFEDSNGLLRETDNEANV